MAISAQSLSSAIVSWYRENARDLPWRKTKNPYLIWVSEIILQQTTVQQGLGYYLKFIHRFPNVNALANATEDEVLRLWAGLGYYSRARNMHETAKYVVENLQAKFPTEHDILIQLKGIGPYTAAAISSFAHNEQRPVVDGNVIRLISRLFAIKDDVTTSSGYKTIKQHVKSLLVFQEAQEFNQAIMEFGALQCVFNSPDCKTCTLNNFCVSHKKDIVAQIPFKKKKTKKRSRYFKVFHIRDGRGHTIIEKRTAQDIWRGLYQFPIIEYTPEDPDRDFSFEFLGSQDYQLMFTRSFKQDLTHQKIHAEIYNIRIEQDITRRLLPGQKIVNNKDLTNYAFPKFIDWYLSDNSIPLN